MGAELHKYPVAQVEYRQVVQAVDIWAEEVEAGLRMIAEVVQVVHRSFAVVQVEYILVVQVELHSLAWAWQVEVEAGVVHKIPQVGCTVVVVLWARP